MFNGTNLTLGSDVDEVTYEKVTQTQDTQEESQVATRLQGTDKTAQQRQT